MTLFLFIIISFLGFEEQLKCVVLRDLSSFKILDKYQLEIDQGKRSFGKLELFELVNKEITLSDGFSKAVHLRKNKQDFYILANWSQLAEKLKLYTLRALENRSYEAKEEGILRSLDFQERFKLEKNSHLRKMYESKNYYIVRVDQEIYWLKKTVRLRLINKEQNTKHDDISRLVKEMNDKLKSFHRTFNNANGKNLQVPFWSVSKKESKLVISFVSQDVTISDKTLRLMKDELIENIHKLRLADILDENEKNRFSLQVEN